MAVWGLVGCKQTIKDAP